MKRTGVSDAPLDGRMPTLLGFLPNNFCGRTETQKGSSRFREANRLASEKSAGLPESAGSYSLFHNQAALSSGALRLSDLCGVEVVGEMDSINHRSYGFAGFNQRSMK